MMPLSSADLASAQAVRNRILDMAKAVQAQDGKAGVDQDGRPGEVSLPAGASRQPVIVVDKSSGVGMPYQDEVMSAQVSFDPSTQTPKTAKIVTDRYYVSPTYGKSADDTVTYQIAHRTEKDGFLGLFGKAHPVQVYSIDDRGFYEGMNRRDTVKVDPSTQNVLSYQSKPYGISWGQSAKEMVTTPAGLCLIGVGAALNGIPGTLGAALLGPGLGAVVGATATFALFTWLKHRQTF